MNNNKITFGRSEIERDYTHCLNFFRENEEAIKLIGQSILYTSGNRNSMKLMWR